MINSLIKHFNYIRIQSDGCISIENLKILFKTKKVSINEKDYKFFQKKNKNLFKKEINYRNKLF